MTHYVLRGVNSNRWLQAVEEKTQTDEGVCTPLLMADVLLDMRTKNNCLSVYFVDDKPEHILPVAIGLAAGSQRLDRFDYVLFRPELLEQLGIRHRRTEGEGKHKGANQLHADLEELTFYQLTELIVYICCDEATQLRRVSKPIVGQEIMKALQNSQIAEAEVAEKILAEARKYHKV